MYLVTGASGNVGSEVVTQLLASGERVHVLTRDAGRVRQWGDRVSITVGDLGQPQVLSEALAQVEGLFLMNRVLDQPRLATLLAAAKESGVQRIVFLSTVLADTPDSAVGRLHKEMELAIQGSGIPAAFVRPGGFMSNTFQWIDSIRSEGIVYNPTGTGRSAPIAPEDIAAVAVRALTDPALASQAFEVTGGELLSVPEQVAILARITGKPLRCVDITVDAAVQQLIGSGVPAPLAAAVGKSYEAIRDGKGAFLRDTVQKLTGRPPLSFEAWASRHAAQLT